MERSRTIRNPSSTVSPSSSLIHFSFFPFTSMPFSPRKSHYKHGICTCTCTPPPLHHFFICLIFAFAISGLSILALLHCTQDPVPNPFSVHLPSSYGSLNFASLAATSSETDEKLPRLSDSVMMALPAHVITRNVSQEERGFWKQPDGGGYRPCLRFSLGYRKASAKISNERRKFLMVAVSGGLNQQRNQIVDAVVIARILEAALVVPVLKFNFIWEDESEFADIFDIEHFKRILRADVRVVSSLPSTHLMSRQRVETQLPRDISPVWIRSKFLKQLNEDGVLILKGLDSKLTKNLPLDLQKLRCKVAFHAIRFASPVLELGNRLARRIWIEGPYIALHLRLEKDVWVRTGCLTGLGAKYDNLISKFRISQPEYLTGRLNMSHRERRLAGLCPLNAYEMERLLKALGAPINARIFIAGGEPFGGSKALQPLAAAFPSIISKEMLAQRGELLPFQNRSSALAALDYIISLSSDIFIPSYGGNMGRAMQGHRAYLGHRKYIKPNRRAMIALLEDRSISDSDFARLIRKLHENSQGYPEPRTNKRDQDVIAYPVPECMCKNIRGIF